MRLITQFPSLQGGCVMPEKAPNGWRNAAAFKFEAQRAAAEKVSRELRFEFDKVLTEPLPEAMDDLLADLQLTRSRNRNGN